MSALAERIEQTNVAVHPASDTTSLLQVITRAASDSSVDIDKMERLMAMHERLVERDAKQAFSTSLTAAQAAMGRIKANKTNSQTKSEYATYGKLDQALRPIYVDHGFALSFDTGDAPAPEMVRVLAHVSHSAGFTRTYHVDMPADGKGAKGGDVMTKTHATGAAMSYGMRYLLKMIFNVAVGEDDKDGNVPTSQELPTITEAQVKELLQLIDRSKSTADKFCQVAKIDAVPDLLAAHFDAAKNMLLDRIKKVEARPAVDPKSQFDAMERSNG
jgi:hypothetical protein